ncbi:semaphorin-7A-like [Paramormyrops kingsleyae]|uniref:Semaphorin-7A-like n=1 Tax=Paramormyrops kingsleyae TaxID=1676925 RepID=A0A3B3Q7K2_9TELE|nr:semaphorin-7A-like [Paramormyrops kingsleyae]
MEIKKKTCFVLFYMCCFLACVAKGLDKPRITLNAEDNIFRNYSLGGNHSRVELLQGPSDTTLYVGGDGKLFLIDFQKRNHSEIPLTYNVTLMHRYPNTQYLYVCGTHGEPVCCNVSMKLTNSSEPLPAQGIAPFGVDEQAPSLFIEDELYTTASYEKSGSKIGIRRWSDGSMGSIWSNQENTQDLRYVALAWSGPKENKLQDKVYAFMWEKNPDPSREAELWVPLVTQICKVDRGGPKSCLQKSWTSHLRARLSCGIPDRKLYFSKLVDVTILYAERWNEGRAYALFSNGWNMSAVCIYTLGDIDRVFTTSSFREHPGQVPQPRPGMCVSDSTKLPRDVLKMMMGPLEMQEWVKPVGDRPLIISRHQYTRIEVDSVMAVDGTQYSVLFLSLEDGRIHKVLEVMGQFFIIAELNVFQRKTVIQNMLLQNSTKKLYVSNGVEVLEVDLHACKKYGTQCVDCVQARDPYCGWDAISQTCTAASSGTIQDVQHGDFRRCEDLPVSSALHSLPFVTEVPLQAAHFLNCPMRSGHAEYNWYYNDDSQGCVSTDKGCLLLIETMGPDHDGKYECKASEGGYERTVALAQLQTAGRAAGLPPPLAGAVCLLSCFTFFL